jgi:hypothetical protein
MSSNNSDPRKASVAQTIARYARAAFVTAVPLFNAQRKRTMQVAIIHARAALAMGRYRRRVD